MSKVGRKIFFDKSNGNIILNMGEKQGLVIEETIDEIISKYIVLSELNRNTFDVIELPFGALAQDFAECNGYRVNPTTHELEFSYPDPNSPETPQVFQKPLSEQVEELKQRDATMQDDINFIFETLGG